MSTPVLVRNRHAIGPRTWAVLAALGGVLTGALTGFLGRWIDARKSKSLMKREVEHTLVKMLSTEFASNLAMVRRLIEKPDERPQPLKTDGHDDVIAPDSPTLTYLRQDARQDYTTRLEALYELILEYNHLVHGQQYDQARALLPKLEQAFFELT